MRSQWPLKMKTSKGQVMNKFNVMQYYKKALDRQNPREAAKKVTKVSMMDSYLSPNVKELRDQGTGKCIGLIEKDGGLYRAINYKKKKAGFTDILSAVSFISETYKNKVSGIDQIAQQLKLLLQ